MCWTFNFLMHIPLLACLFRRKSRAFVIARSLLLSSCKKFKTRDITLKTLVLELCPFYVKFLIRMMVPDRRAMVTHTVLLSNFSIIFTLLVNFYFPLGFSFLYFYCYFRETCAILIMFCI